jgi:hypothetical protein
MHFRFRCYSTPDMENPVLEDAPYDELNDRVADYYRYHGSQPHVVNLKLRR